MTGSRAAPSGLGPPVIEHAYEAARATRSRAPAIDRLPNAHAVSVHMTEDAAASGERLELPLDGDGEHLEQAAHEAPLTPVLIGHTAGQREVLGEDLVEACRHRPIVHDQVQLVV